MGPIDRTTQHLEDQGIGYEVVEHEQAFTAASEAAAAGVRPDNAAKSILLRNAEGYRLAVIPASERIDLGKVCDLLGLSRTEMRLATEDEMATDFPDFELGAIPPLGELLPAPEILDRRVLDHEKMLCNGGDHSHSLVLDPQDIVRITGAQIADVCAD
jgi:Ala-tRNA(Pro) deacylase